MKTFVIILGFVLAFSLLSNGWQWIVKRKLKADHNELARDYQKSNALIQMQRDSIVELETVRDALRAAMVLQVNDLRDSLKWQQIQTAQMKKQYEKEKRYRVPANISDAGLDSLVSRFLESHN